MATEEKIGVLIADDVPETRENIRKILQFEGDIEVVGAASSGEEAIQLAKETKPEVVLMDINMPDMDGIAATEAIREQVPFTQIVILSVQSDSNYMRRAMLAGARDFLAKPPDVVEMVAAIRRAGTLAHSEKEKKTGSLVSQMPTTRSLQTAGLRKLGRVITIYGPKGGVGKTTITANLAVALQAEDTPVAVVDSDLQFGDLSFFFKEQASTSVLDLAYRSEELDFEIVEEAMVKHDDSGVHILAAPPRPESAEAITASQFKEVLSFLRQIYAYILVDTPSELNDITIAALESSDIDIVLTTQDIPSIKNVHLVLELADAIGIDSEGYILVLNRYDKRRNIAPEKVGDSFKKEVAAVVPVDEKTVIPAMDRGIPFLLQANSQPVSRGILGLADVIRERVAALDEEAEPAGLG